MCAVFAALVSSVCYGQRGNQENANAIRVYLWDYPIGDSLYYEGLVQDTTFLVVMFRADGIPIEVSMGALEYRTMQADFDSEDHLAQAKEHGTVGYEYLVSFYENLSRLKQRDLRGIPKHKRSIAEALNAPKKYILRGMSAVRVRGERKLENGTVIIVPILDEVVTQNNEQTLPRREERKFIDPGVPKTNQRQQESVPPATQQGSRRR